MAGTRSKEIRRPAVAGTFYPSESFELRNAVREMLARALGRRQSGAAPKAMIVPHAGYVYSGPVAATAYATLAPAKGRIRRVVLLGPCHYVPIRGAALPEAGAFETPLGRVPLSREAYERALALPGVRVNNEAHRPEHSLEVQLPFLQESLEEFELLPLVLGHSTPEETSEILDALWGGEETVLLVSSDLSHYLPYEEARTTDRFTAEAILKLDCPVESDRACGAAPINGLLLAARRKRLQARLLDLRNSGDTAGDKRRVVGYGAFAFHEGDPDA